MPSHEQVIEDLAAFSDLGTAPTVIEHVATHLLVDWTYQGVQRRAQVQGMGGTQCNVSVDDGPHIPYGEFLASPIMADLGRLATKIRLMRGVVRTASAQTVEGFGRIYPTDWYVDPRLSSTIGAQGADGEALERLRAFADSSGDDATRILFLMAEAGQGKSSVLEEFTVQQADRYLAGETATLALYIDAQGRGLARLDEVISRQLNDLQFLLGYAALVTLAREGLLLLVIDGFDELIGSRGTFDDAFRSLTAFLELLDGSGSVIAAGRSTYFMQEYEARGRMLSDSLRYSLEQAFLAEWTRSDQDRFLTRALDATVRAGQARESLRSAFEEFQDDEQLSELLSRPLFARALFIILLHGGRKPKDLTSERLIPYLAHEYLDREAKLKLRNTEGPFLTVEQLVEYYTELALQMWELETRELDVSDAELIIDTWSESSWELEGGDRAIVRQRAGNLPFLAVGETSQRVRFEHEVFFGYFLALSLAPVLEGSQYALSMLSRGRLDPLSADMMVQVTSASPQGVLDGLAELASVRHPRAEQIQVNTGALGAALLRSASKAGVAVGLRVHSMTMSGESLARVELRQCRFQSLQLERVDLRGAQLSECVSLGLQLDAVLIDPERTRLEIDGVEVSRDISGLQFEDDEGVMELTYDPTVVRGLAISVGLIEEGPPESRFDIRTEVVDRVEKMCRAFRKANSIGSNHSRFGVLFTDDLGRDISAILQAEGLVVQDAQKQTGGGAQTFLRKRFDEAELMAPLAGQASSAEVDAAWSRLAQL